MNGVMDELEGTGSSSDHRQLLERSALASSDGGETWHIPWARGYTEDAHLLASKEAKVGILFQDAHILVVDKPAFLPSENTRAIKDSVRSRIEDLLRVDADPEVAPAIRVYLPHRLDWETSGVLIIARTREAHRALSMQFEARQVRKVYIADVIGSPPSSSGVCELPLSADAERRPLQRVDLGKSGKPCRTTWTVDDCSSPKTPSNCRLRLEPLSGRRHQLRMHCLVLGCAIAGDGLYEPPPMWREAKATLCTAGDEGVDELAGQMQRPNRLHLHAAEIYFSHPATGEAMHVRSEPPFSLSEI